MASESRASQFAKLHKVLKKHYKPVASDPQRPILEHLLFGCLLEDAQYGPAEESLAALTHTFFDWNEIRVSSVAELSEVVHGLPDPRAVASRFKKLLQCIFEQTYSFDLEHHRKGNLGPTVKWLQQLDGSTPFIVSYVVQAGLGGHSIPVDTGSLRVLEILDLVTEKNVQTHNVPGLERAIAKAKGVEFGSLLHQFGADFTLNPYGTNVRKLILEVDPEAKTRLPQRRKKMTAKRAAARKAAAETDAATEESGKEKTPDTEAAQQSPTKKATAKKTPAKAAPTKKSTAKKPSTRASQVKKTTKKTPPGQSGSKTASTKKPAKKTDKPTTTHGTERAKKKPR